MSFLAPWFLLGALAIGVPIYLHLIRRRPRNRVAFSSLIFLEETPPKVERRQRPEDLWLLLLRCLVLLLLAFGFARPLLERDAEREPGDTGARALSFLVDRSASMRREGLWEAALDELSKRLAGLAPGDRVSVDAFGRGLEPVIGFDEWTRLEPPRRREEVMERLRAMGPGWEATGLDEALIAAAGRLDELSEDGDRPVERRLTVVTDLQEGARIGGLSGYAWPAEVGLEWVPVAGERGGNAGLEVAAVAGGYFGGLTATGVRVRVTNAAGSAGDRFRVRWPGDEVEEGGAGLEVYVPPGESRVLGLPDAAGSAPVLRLEGDGEPFDNEVWMTGRGGVEARVVVVEERPASDPQSPVYYLGRALRDAGRQTVRLRQVASWEALSGADLAETDWIIVTGEIGTGGLEALRAWVAEGGVALWTLRDRTAAEAWALVFGAVPDAVREAQLDRPALLGPVAFDDPVFEIFSDPRFGDFTKIQFWRYRDLGIAEGWTGGRVLASFDNGDAAFVRQPVGEGTLFVLSTGWGPADSQWALSTKFVPWLYSILRESVPAAGAMGRYRVGDAVSLASLASDMERPSGGWVVGTPSGGREVVEEGDLFRGTREPGAYTVDGLPAGFVVQLDPAESRTAVLAEETLEQWGLPGAGARVEEAEADPEAARMRDRTELEARQKIWRWLVGLAIVFVVTETLIAGWRGRVRAAAV